MTTYFEIVIDGEAPDYARQAAAAAFRLVDQLENELSRFVEHSEISRANRLGRGEAITLTDDAFECLVLAADVTLATQRAFDAGFRSVRGADLETDAPPYALEPDTHTLVSRADRLALDLGAIGKGYALDRAADVLREWSVASGFLNCGGSTVLALAAPSVAAGWTTGIGEGAGYRELALTNVALSGSGTAVKGQHLIDPRTGQPATRTNRTWASAGSAAVSDALSTAFFVMTEAEIAAFCIAHPDIGGALTVPGEELSVHGALRNFFET